MHTLGVQPKRRSGAAPFSKANSLQTSTALITSSSSEPELDTDLDDACAMYSTQQQRHAGGGSIGSAVAPRAAASGRSSAAASTLPAFTLPQLQLLQQLLRAQQPPAAMQRSASDESLPVSAFFGS